MLLDWCKPVHNKIRINIVAHWITRLFIFFLISGVATFYVFQLIVDFLSMTNIHKIVPNLTWLLTYVCCLFAFLYYNFKRRDLLHFFKRWAKFEKSRSILLQADYSRSTFFNEKRLATLMYSSYFIMTSFSILSICYAIKKTPDAPYLLSYYPTLRDMLTVPIVVAIHLTGLFICWVGLSLLDLVPGIVFYCAGKQIQSIEQELKDDFESKIL